ncbi:hypothetical protein D3C87_1030910 [compost metagenome]
MDNEVAILKAAIANLMDHHFGSTRGWTEAREVKMVSEQLQVSPEMARIMLKATDETVENKAFDII